MCCNNSASAASVFYLLSFSFMHYRSKIKVNWIELKVSDRKSSLKQTSNSSSTHLFGLSCNFVAHWATARMRPSKLRPLIFQSERTFHTQYSHHWNKQHSDADLPLNSVYEWLGESGWMDDITDGIIYNNTTSNTDNHIMHMCMCVMSLCWPCLISSAVLSMRT